MTEPEKTAASPAKQEVQRVGRYLTVQNAVQIIIFIVAISGFYYKTSYRLDSIEESQKGAIKIQQYHAEWLIRLSMKTGEPPPPRRDQ